MDLYDKILNKEDIESIIELIKEDKKIITRLYSYETIFSKTLNYLLVNRNKNPDLEYLFTIFIDILSGSLINKPSDLVSCIQKIKNKKGNHHAQKEQGRNRPGGNLLNLLGHHHIIIHHFPMRENISKATLLHLRSTGLFLHIVHQHQCLWIISVYLQNKVKTLSRLDPFTLPHVKKSQ